MTQPVSRFDRFLHGLLWVLAALIIPLALVVGIGRELMPLVAGQKAAVEHLLSEKTGLQIRLGGLEGDWHHLSPILVAHDVAIHDPHRPGKPLLVVPSVTTEPDWWASLRDLSPRLRTTIHGLRLTFAPAPDGGLEVVEFAGLGKSDPAKARRALRWLLAQPGLGLYDSRLSWQASGSPTQAVSDVSLQQFNRQGDYRLQATFRLGESAALQQALLVVAGDPLAWRDARWQTYLQIQDLQAWQPWLSLLPASWNARLNQGSARLWLSGAGARPDSATLSLSDVGLALQPPDRGTYAAEALKGVVSLRRQGDGWQVGGDDLAGRINDQPLPLQRLAVDYAPDRLVVSAARVSLAGVHALVSRERMLPETLRKLLDVTQPSGWLPRVQIRAERSGEEAWRLVSANSEFKALTLKPTDTLPGVRDLAGWVQGGPAGGLLYLDTRRGELNLHTVFREPVPVDLLRGGVRWLHADGVWHIDSDVLRLTNADADGHAQLAVRIPDGRPQDARLDLLAGISRGKVGSAWRYVPWHAAGDKTLAWLRHSLTAGEVEQGSFLFSGNVHHDEHHPGRFEMMLRVKGATLDYVTGWPALQGLDGAVRIAGRTLEVTGERASIMGASASKLVARIPDLHHGVLAVDTDLAMDLSDLDRLLAESPLKASAGGVASALALKGPAQAHLNMSIPLHHDDGPPEIKVTTTVQDAEIGLPAERLTFSQVSGPVSFDSRKGLDGALHGTLWGRPAQVGLSGEARARRWRAQSVDVDTLVDATALGQWLGTDLTPWLRGQTPVRVALDIPVGTGGQTDLRVTSPMTGMRVLLPEPFAKAPGESLPLSYQGRLGSDEYLARASLGDSLQAGMVWRDGRLQRLLLRSGLPGVAWPDQPGLFVEARLPELDVMAWRNLLPAEGQGSVKSGLPAFRQLTLQAGRVVAGDHVFGPTRARIQRDGDDWQIRVSGAQPRKLPDWPVTDIAATLSRSQGLWRLDPLEVRQPQASFSGSLSWGQGSRAPTTLNGTLEGKDVKRLMEQAGQGSFITGDSVSVKAALQWPGGPDDFSPRRLQGSLEARLKNGRLLDAGNGINLVTRVFGLLNASNIMRRLRFDFTDVTRKGLNFDQLSLQGDLDDGFIKPAGFDLDGPTVSIRGKGSVNLNTGEVDQQLRVGVPVSSAVPVVAGLLAGPVVGGALVAADLLLDKPLSRLTSVRYHVTGTWDSLKVNDEALESLPGKGQDEPGKPAAGKDD